MKIMKGKLIVFEGIDGVGKSTQCKLLKEYLMLNKHTVQLFREPTDGPYGNKIRSLSIEGRSSPEEEYNLFILDRKENVKDNIIPCLNRGEIVILDRYYFSTIAYQGALGLSISRIKEENEAFAPIPDLVIILELSVNEAITRIIEKRKENTNLFETESYLKKVQTIFNTFRDPYIVRIKSEGTINEIHKRIISVVDKKLLLNL